LTTQRRTFDPPKNNEMKFGRKPKKHKCHLVAQCFCAFGARKFHSNCEKTGQLINGPQKCDDWLKTKNYDS
jgi:hypothetical protein